MKRIYLVVLVVLTFSCSEETGGGKSCSSDLSTFQINTGVIYTGEVITLGTPSLCPSDEVTVMVNGQEAEITTDDLGTITFVVPTLTVSSASIEVTAGKSTKNLGSFNVVKAAGTWKEIASFAGDGRAYMVNFSTSADGYLYAGNRSSLNDYTVFTDLYKYNPTDNAWTKVLSNDAFNQDSEAIAGDKLFLQGKTYSISENTFSTINHILYHQSPTERTRATRYFTSQLSAYAISNIGDHRIEIQKYDEATDSWAIVKENAFDPDDYFSFSFAVEYNNKVYIGVLPLNSPTTEVWMFDGASNSFAKVSSVSTDIEGSTQDLKYLFTLNDLGYFIEMGEASVDYDGKFSIIKARNNFYVYNFATSEWHIVKTELPVSSYGIAALSIGNRGFAGLGATEATPVGLNYSQKFFEFIPTR